MGSFDQVFVVPTEPIGEGFVTFRGDLISEEPCGRRMPRFGGSTTFNQLVMQQTVFNAFVHPNILAQSPSSARRAAIEKSGRRPSSNLHAYGVGDAADEVGTVV